MMPFAAYNSNGVRLLCGILADATISARKPSGMSSAKPKVPTSRRDLSAASRKPTTSENAIPVRSSAPLFESFSRRTP